MPKFLELSRKARPSPTITNESIYLSDSLAFIGFGQYLCDIAQELNQEFTGDAETPMDWSDLQEFDEYDHLTHIY